MCDALSFFALNPLHAVTGGWLYNWWLGFTSGRQQVKMATNLPGTFGLPEDVNLFLPVWAPTLGRIVLESNQHHFADHKKFLSRLNKHLCIDVKGSLKMQLLSVVPCDKLKGFSSHIGSFTWSGTHIKKWPHRCERRMKHPSPTH